MSSEKQNEQEQNLMARLATLEQVAHRVLDAEEKAKTQDKMLAQILSLLASMQTSTEPNSKIEEKPTSQDKFFNGEEIRTDVILTPL
jgi:hypothetical protein